MSSLVIQLILIIIIFISALIIYKITRAYIKERRIAIFSLNKKDVLDISLFEKINRVFWRFIHKLSNHLGNSKLLSEYANDYDKFILTNEGNLKSNIDYITIKVITSIFAVILVVVLILLGTLPNNLFLLVLFILIGFFVPDLFWHLNYFYKCNSIFEKLYESIIILSKSLKKYNIEDSIVNVIDTLHGPIQDEYKKILIDLSYNIPIKEAYLRFYKRTKIKELKNVYHILDINSDNLKEAFDLIRVEFDYLNKKNDITSNVNSVVNVLSSIYLLIPITFIIMVLIVYPDYFDIVNNYPAGYIVIIILALLYVLLFLAIKSIKGDKR